MENVALLVYYLVDSFFCCYCCCWLLSCLCLQFVLFLGVTVFLASTYITLNTQVTQTKDTESVIKVVQPEDNVKPVDDRLVKDAAIGNDAIIKVPDGDAGNISIIINLA